MAKSENWQRPNLDPPSFIPDVDIKSLIYLIPRFQLAAVIEPEPSKTITMSYGMLFVHYPGIGGVGVGGITLGQAIVKTPFNAVFNADQSAFM